MEVQQLDHSGLLVITFPWSMNYLNYYDHTCIPMMEWNDHLTHVGCVCINLLYSPTDNRLSVSDAKERDRTSTVAR